MTAPPTPTRPPFISKRPESLAAWAQALSPQTLPVLVSTASQLEDWREVEDNIDVHQLAEDLCIDPLMSMKVFSDVGLRLRGSERTQPETITAALLLLGIPPFFRAFGPQLAIDDVIGASPACMAGFQRSLSRAQMAGRFTLSFAAHRLDQDASMLYGAASLHNIVDLALWTRAPILAIRMQEMRLAQPKRRSADIQLEVLGWTAHDIARVWFETWELPRVIGGVLGLFPHNDQAQLKTIDLGRRLARHWTPDLNDAGIPDDIEELCDLLQISQDAAKNLVTRVAQTEESSSDDDDF